MAAPVTPVTPVAPLAPLAPVAPIAPTAPDAPVAPVAPVAPASIGRYRWVICGLLFLAATINYVDRQVIGILKPTLQQQFGWSEIDYADIVFSFQLAYAIGLLVAGRLIDRLGTRLGFALAVLVWSIAAMAHAEAPVYGPAVAALLGVAGLAYAPSVAGFIAARFALGLGEAGNFPASIKAVAEWYPAKERALATGIFNSGTNIGAVVAPLLGTVDHDYLRVVLGLRSDGRDWIFLAALVAADVWATGNSPACRPSGARTYPLRSFTARRPCAAPRSLSPSSNVGVCDRKVPDRSGLVVVSLLGS